MREFESVSKEVLELTDVRCDHCRKSCLVEIGLDYKEAEAGTFLAEWGYGSSHDGQTWKAELCQDCATQVKEWIDSGAGTGTLVTNYLGDISIEEAKRTLEYCCSEWTGMSMERFLVFRETSKIPGTPGFRQADWYANIAAGEAE